MKEDTIKCIKNNLDTFNWWLEDPTRKVWVKTIGFPKDQWHKMVPKWDFPNLVYVKDDEFAEFRKALVDGKGVYMKMSNDWVRVRKVDFFSSAFGYSIGKPRWRAKNGAKYWRVCSDCQIDNVTEVGSTYDDRMFEIGNYHRTREQAQIILDKFKQILEEK